jgi:hypothetical protein
MDTSMKRAFVQVVVVASAGLSLNVNWYNIETQEQGYETFIYEDSASLTGDQLHAAIDSFIAAELGILSENVVWI